MIEADCMLIMTGNFAALYKATPASLTSDLKTARACNFQLQ